MILIYASDGDPDQVEHVNTSGPVKLLFAIQRVNRACQAGVKNCKLLQQRMLLVPYPAETPGLPFWAPVIWLQSCMKSAGTYQLAISGDMDCAFQDYEINSTLWLYLRWRRPEKTYPPHAASWLSPEASWRRMKIYCTEEYILKKAICDMVDGTFPWTVSKQKEVTLGDLNQWFGRLISFEERFPALIEDMLATKMTGIEETGWMSEEADKLCAELGLSTAL